MTYFQFCFLLRIKEQDSGVLETRKQMRSEHERTPISRFENREESI
jgi:hypothetical protein